MRGRKVKKLDFINMLDDNKKLSIKKRQNNLIYRDSMIE